MRDGRSDGCGQKGGVSQVKVLADGDLGAVANKDEI